MRKSLLLSLFILIAGAAEIFACSCAPSAPCQSFGRADVVFVGKVVGSRIQRTEKEYKDFLSEPKEVTYDVGEIYFEVIEGFKGTEKGARMPINSSTGGGDCGQWFLRGETYVVFATKEGSNTSSGISNLTYGGNAEIERKSDPERLWTNICSGNRHIGSSDEALQYLRNLPKPGDGGLVVGTIFESIKDYSEERLTGKPMSGARIRAKSSSQDGKEFFGTSDEKGRFSVSVPEGKYIVQPVLDKALRYEHDYSDEASETKIIDRGCEVKTFWVTNDSLISGKVVDSTGKEVNRISIELIPLAKNRDDQNFYRESDYVSEDGEFEFKGIPPGKYYISLNYADRPDDDSPYPTVFYPSVADRAKAEIFEVKLGTKIKDLVFKMPGKLSKRTLTGSVVWKNGKPAAGAEVQLVDTEFDRDVFFKAPITDSKGKFKMEWFIGRKYKIKVIVWQKNKDGMGIGIAGAETDEFVLDDQTPDMEIVLNIIDPRKKSITKTTVRSK